ncbi:Predicted arabinose efflux permease, MFS family [Saccharopolyspora shandongensis]|uniref:Predicted arabinose efflux permease, MFS family n=1 Tax=Saccharopolyspora shandongensis TaxID=418495 RepID=A0A1H2TBU5_9PSEU|nr:MFS transporter [Saccharopolyspora shandongensis]SDW41381.1 Predicted arabinose efflux permease, MFS family [Saccharopolyspora shandongensis]
MTASDPTTHANRTPKKLMIAALIASSIEWYDFFIYATAAALVFGHLFFPGASPLIGVLLSFATFWAGFIARPVGGLIFGHLGDKIGRKPAVVTCLIMMGTATFLIGVLPGAASIGVFAPILLVTLRFLQGIAVGGQWGGIVLLLTENAGRGRRGMAGTFGQMGVPFGVILGNITFLAVGAALSPEAFQAWGWRIPFLASAVLAPVVLYIQMKIEDTPVFQELKERKEKADAEVVKAPLMEVLRSSKRTVLLGAGLLFATNSIFYISISGLLDYGTRELGMPRQSLLAVTLVSSAVGIVVIFVSGALSDRWGRRPLIVAGAVLLAVWAFPFFWLVDTASIAGVAIAATVGSIGSSLTYGPLAAYLSELFAPRVRYSGASLAYQLAAILVSGGTPFIMTALLAATGSSASVSVYLLLMGLCTLGSVLLLRETNKAGSAEPQHAREAVAEA